MNKKEYYSRSNNYLKELGGRKNHIIRGNMKEQYQGVGIFKRTRKGWRISIERQWNYLCRRKNLYSK